MKLSHISEITIATAPKKFTGNFKIIQDNAINSWIRLCGEKNVYLFGDSETETNAKRLGVNYHWTKTSNIGVPLLNSIVSTCRKEGMQYILYINSDIILLDSFSETYSLVRKKLKEKFLLVGQRTNIDCIGYVDFSHKNWQKKILNIAKETGVVADKCWIDYFLFHKDVFINLPPLRVGRAGFDNYLIYLARQSKVIVVDATSSINALHQNHDYSHNPIGKTDSWNGPDAKTNIKLAGGHKHLFTIDECNLLLQNEALIKKGHPLSYFFTLRYILGVLPLESQFWRFIPKLSDKLKAILTNQKLRW